MLSRPSLPLHGCLDELVQRSRVPACKAQGHRSTKAPIASHSHPALPTPHPHPYVVSWNAYLTVLPPLATTMTPPNTVPSPRTL